MQFLLLSCSAKKVVTDDRLKAIDLYSGVFFSVYKKAVRTSPSMQEKVKLLIVSAKYGLIEAYDPIAYYDLRMTSKIASKQRENNTQKLLELVEHDKPEAMTAAMGRTYLKSIDFSALPISTNFINGEIGVMLHGLKEWLDKLNGGNNDAD